MRTFRGARVAGIGVISSAGRGVEPLAAACRVGRSLVTADPQFGVLTARVADSDLAQMETRLPANAARAERMTRIAFDQAMRASGFGELDAETGVVFATTTGHMQAWEAELPLYVAGETLPAQFAAVFRDQHLGRSLDSLDLRGPLQVLTSACAAGTQALALACSWLRTGKVKRVVVGAAETLTTTTVRGFGCFNLLSAGVAAPFDRRRDGINLGEAAVFLCLDDRVDRDGYGWVLGGGSALDAFDMTAPHPEGRGLYRAMQRALQTSQVAATAIDWVCAHGTGTEANDLAEAAAIEALFGATLSPFSSTKAVLTMPPFSSTKAVLTMPPVSSTKAVHGHTLAASGLLETAVALQAIAAGEIPPSANLVEPDPRLRMPLVRRAQAASINTVLKSTLGFGGVNAAVVLARRPAACPL